MERISLGELKERAHEYKEPVRSKNNHQVMPMFLPTDISSRKGEGVIQVVTRQKFMNTTINQWVTLHASLAGAMVLALVTLLLIPVNIFLAALTGLGAGWLYGMHQEMDFRVNHELKHRWLLEGT